MRVTVTDGQLLAALGASRSAKDDWASGPRFQAFYVREILFQKTLLENFSVEQDWVVQAGKQKVSQQTRQLPRFPDDLDIWSSFLSPHVMASSRRYCHWLTACYIKDTRLDRPWLSAECVHERGTETGTRNSLQMGIVNRQLKEFPHAQNVLNKTAISP